jgi:hypothetical protein
MARLPNNGAPRALRDPASTPAWPVVTKARQPVAVVKPVAVKVKPAGSNVRRSPRGK